MEPQREKKLQRALKILTGLTVLLTLFVVWKAGSKPETPKAKKQTVNQKASVLHGAEKPKKVRRPTNTNSNVILRQAQDDRVSNEKNLVDTLLEKEDGEGLLLEGKLSDALEYYRKKAAQNPQDAENYRILGDLSFTNKDYKNAEEYYDLALALRPNDQKLFIKSVRSLLNQRKFGEAFDRLEKTSLASSPALELYRGAIASLLNQSEKSKKHLEIAASETDPVISEKAKRILNAYEEFEFTTDGKIEHLQTLLAKAFDEIGEYQMAISLGLDALKSKDDYRDAWIVIGHAYFAEKKYSDASAALRRALELDSSVSLAHFYLGLTLGALHEHQKAIEELEKAESQGFDGGFLASSQKAKSFDTLQNYEKAYEWYVKALDQKGTLAQPHEYVRPITLALEKFHTPEKAYLLAALSFSRHPRHAESLNLLGWTALEFGKLDEAKRHLEQALALDPTLAAPYYNLGKLSEIYGEPAKAREYFEKALALAKKRKDASIEQATLLKLQSTQPSS